MMMVMMIPALGMIVIAIRAVMMMGMVMMPPTVMVMVVISVICAGIASNVGNGSWLCEKA